MGSCEYLRCVCFRKILKQKVPTPAFVLLNFHDPLSLSKLLYNVVLSVTVRIVFVLFILFALGLLDYLI